VWVGHVVWWLFEWGPRGYPRKIAIDPGPFFLKNDTPVTIGVIRSTGYQSDTLCACVAESLSLAGAAARLLRES